MIGRKATSWQVILADLALILFLTTLAGFVAVRSQPASREEDAIIAAPQALYRRGGETTLYQWLGQQQADSRLRLTIFARYRVGERLAVWEQARDLMAEAQVAGFSPRVVLEPAGESDIYAALAYDELTPESGSIR